MYLVPMQADTGQIETDIMLRNTLHKQQILWTVVPFQGNCSALNKKRYINCACFS